MKKEILKQKLKKKYTANIAKKDSLKDLLYFNKCWTIQCLEKKHPTLKNPILLVGLPGIGNVGKIVVDFLIDELKAKPLYAIQSYHFPHTVFVNEKNLVDMPTIELFYKKGNATTQDFLFLAGDVQPTEQTACYEFCDIILNIFQELKGREIISIGGIGLYEVGELPKVFCTGNRHDIIEKYVKGTVLNPHLYGVVGPIVGVAGVILGLSMQRNIPAISLLAETIAHPYYVGIKGSKEILSILQKKFSFSVDINKLDKEIKEFEKELRQTAEQIEESQRQSSASLGRQSYIG